jgi:hypothetical protein
MTEERLASIATAVRRELGAAPSSPAELGERLTTLDVELPGDPWARWLLLALCRHEARQAWVGEIVRGRLGGDRQGTITYMNWKTGHYFVGASHFEQVLAELRRRGVDVDSIIKEPGFR